MSIYSELLRMALDDGGDGRDQPVRALLLDALSCRARLTGSVAGRTSTRRTNPADRVGDRLAYDAALVRLCNRLGLKHDLTLDGDDVSARARAEDRLADRLPSLAAALGRSATEQIRASRSRRGAGAGPAAPADPEVSGGIRYGIE